MAEIESYRASGLELVGEIEAPRRRTRAEPDFPADIWPGKFTDIASLERNADEWRRLERRQAIADVFRALFRRR